MTARQSPAAGPDLVSAVRLADVRHGLLPAGQTVVVGVSGGPDSVALLDALRVYGPDRDVRLHAAHVDHMQRPDSVDDAAFVAHLLGTWEVPATLEARDAQALAARLGRGIEDASRTTRYACLAAVAARVGASTVAVAHTADDQAETVLMHFLRGAGLSGLSGMRALAAYPLSPAAIAELEDVPVAPPGGPTWPPRLVRPFLAVTRDEVLTYLAERGQPARSDASNLDRRFARNRLRLDIIPELETIYPGLRRTLVRNAASIADDLRLIEVLVDEAWARVAVERDGEVRLMLEAWSVEPPGVQRRLVRRAVKRLRGAPRDLGWGHVETVRDLASSGRVGDMVSLPGGLRMERDYETLVLAPDRPGFPPPQPPPDPLPLNVPGRTQLAAGWVALAELRDRRPDDPAVRDDPWTAALDADALGVDVAVRGRRPGDRLQPLGLGGRHKTLQDLFVDARVPRRERGAWPIVVSGGRIVWVPGHRIDARARVRPETRRVLEITVRPPGRVTATM